MKSNIWWLFPFLIIGFVACHSNKSLPTAQAFQKKNYQEVQGLIDAETLDQTELDSMPQYQGGLPGLMHDVVRHLQYPDEAIINQIEGIVVVQYIINKQGYLEDISIKKSVHPILDAEAVRVVKRLKRWFPGMKDGKPVKVQFSQPVEFRLD
ncbi:MAG: energy transducer TonB [Saprospiraceae bacterium]|nr:energy transducer TonB [Saprospiraceae bacterium]